MKNQNIFSVFECLEFEYDNQEKVGLNAFTSLTYRNIYPLFAFLITVRYLGGANFFLPFNDDIIYGIKPINNLFNLMPPQHTRPLSANPVYFHPLIQNLPRLPRSLSRLHTIYDLKLKFMRQISRTKCIYITDYKKNNPLRFLITESLLR